MSIGQFRGCPVCGEQYVGVWDFDAGERPTGESFPPGRCYIHEPATPVERDADRDDYDGRACCEFADGSRERDVYPPQPIEDPGVRPGV